MDKTQRGNKHVCSKCNTKFFDFNKKIIVCPRCNTEVTTREENIMISEKIATKESSKKIDSEISLEEDVGFDDDLENVIDDEIELGEDEIAKD